MQRAVAVRFSMLLAAACSSSDVTNFGPPGGLTGKMLPLPSGGGGDDAGSDGGGGSSSSSGGAGSSSTSSGGANGIGGSSSSSGAAGSSGGGGSSGSARMDAAVYDAGPIGCAVSWTAQIFPNMTATGKWKCADATSCHGGLQAPKMTADATATYKALSAYTMQFAPQKLPYVLPGSTDATKSGIVCNLSGSTCGTQMPLAGVIAGTSALSAQEIATLNAWVACGAPAN